MKPPIIAIAIALLTTTFLGDSTAENELATRTTIQIRILNETGRLRIIGGTDALTGTPLRITEVERTLDILIDAPSPQNIRLEATTGTVFSISRAP
jgi:hypothetical protein